MKISLTVGNSKSEERTLLYRPRSTPVALRWMSCVARANAQSEIREAHRWYNFEQRRPDVISTLTDRIHKTIEQINAIYPDLITERIDPLQLQQSVNHLHVHFADSHLVRMRIEPNNLTLWSDFNNDLHALENAIREHATSATDLPGPMSFSHGRTINGSPCCLTITPISPSENLSEPHT